MCVEPSCVGSYLSSQSASLMSTRIPGRLLWCWSMWLVDGGVHLIGSVHQRMAATDIIDVHSVTLGKQLRSFLKQVITCPYHHLLHVEL